MKFLANENYPKPSIVFLRNKGFEVKSIQEGYGGIPDEEVVAIAEHRRPDWTWTEIKMDMMTLTSGNV